MASALARLVAAFHLALWSAQVDDIACAVVGGSREEVVRQTVKLREAAAREIGKGRQLPLAPAKTTVVATDKGTVEELAMEIGQCAEDGFWRKMLGVDYGLAQGDVQGCGLSRRGKKGCRGARAVGPRAG